MEITMDELIVRFRRLQEGHRVDSGYNRGVSDCIRVLLELGEDCGCSREIALAIRHPYGGKPTWYIKCACGMELAETVRIGNKKEQDKIQNKLIKEWNRQ